jgi:hypothetical protein
MELISVRTQEEFCAMASDQSIEQKIAEEVKNKEKFYLQGFCNICEEKVHFLGDWRYSDGKVPNYRERLVCPKCRLNNRQRLMGYLVKKQLEKLNLQMNFPHIYCYETVTPFYKWLVNIVPTTIGSEFLGVNLLSGSVINGIRHENALNLSFNDETMDLMISQDVFEHVTDLNRAISEVKRILKPNGTILFSIPFHFTMNQIRQRATIYDGEIKHFYDAIYHGNPIDKNGSLVFWDIGWDIFDLFKNNGMHLEILAARNLECGHIGELPFIFCGTKIQNL